MDKFYFGSESDSDNDNPDSLPFPAPLSRDAFSTNINAPFSPTVFLATLRHRHQTLEDLRTELRTKSKDLEMELVELVNKDHVDFVGLGSSLSGGDGKVEDLKMGLWGFRRDIEGVVGRIEEVIREVQTELKVRECVRRGKMLARTLLALSQRLDELLSLLLLDGSTPVESTLPLFHSDNNAEEDEGLTSIRRLKRIVSGYRYVTQHLVPCIPEGHPFLNVQLERAEQVRSTLLLDLGSALKEFKLRGDTDKTIVILGFYADLTAEGEAVNILKRLKKES